MKIFTTTEPTMPRSHHQRFSQAEGSSRSLCSGPRKVMIFCLLSVFLPSIIISVTLLMRFVVLGSSTYFLAPSDMMMMDKKISTTWCQREIVKINTTFTAYLTEGAPELVRSPVPLSYTKNMIIPDDEKEYWGFYLHKGTTFSIKTCAKHKGGSLLIVKGRDHLEHCAYIGEPDSAGDSDGFSDSNSEEESKGKIKTIKLAGMQTPSSSEERTLILAKIRSYVRKSSKGFKKLRKNLADWNLLDEIKSKENSKEKSRENSTSIENEQINQTNSENKTLTSNFNNDNDTLLESNNTLEEIKKDLNVTSLIKTSLHGKIVRKKRQDSEVRKLTESGENGAFEDLSNDNDNDTDRRNSSHEDVKLKVNHNHVVKHKNEERRIWEASKDNLTMIGGTFWMKGDGEPDGSQSESESSYSSSEEALARCEGVIAIFYLPPQPVCEFNISSHELSQLFTYENKVNVSGYYYFIFGSENEKRDNFFKAQFKIDRFLYKLPDPVPNCTLVNECQVPFDFSSNQKLIVSIPEPPPEKDGLWDEVYVGESECEPRAGLYLLFVLIVPILILLCAFM